LVLHCITHSIAVALSKWCITHSTAVANVGVTLYHPLNCSGSEQTLVLHCITHSTAVALSKR